MADYNNIKAHHKDQLLTVLSYYMSQEIRQKLMLECPAAYNAWCGYEVVEVVRTVNGTKIVEGTVPTVTATVFEGGITFSNEIPQD
jgi:hypothetical protein